MNGTHKAPNPAKPRTPRAWATLAAALAACAGCALLTLKKDPWRAAEQVPINLAPLFDNDGISSAAKPEDGNFDCPDHPANIPGSAYPQEHLPTAGQAFSPPEQPRLRLLFPRVRDHDYNNVVCAGQKIKVPETTYRALWVLGAAENGAHEGTVRLNYQDGRVDVPLMFPDWCAEPEPGHVAAATCPFRYSWQQDSRQMSKEPIACRLFAVRLPIACPRVLESFNLPYNTRMHIFAATLDAEAWTSALQTQVDDCVAFYSQPARQLAVDAAALTRVQTRLLQRLTRTRAAPAGGERPRELQWLSTQLDYCAHLMPQGRGNILPRDARTILRTHAQVRRDLDAIGRGRNPFAGRKGVMLKSYQSDVDGQPQPYSVAVPPTYDPSRRMPLVLHLHGHGWYRAFQGHPAPRIQGVIVASPHGRGSTDYMSVGDLDAMRVIQEVRRDYSIDENRIYAMGHSMGGTGAWGLAGRHPGVFAAIAPNAGNADHRTWQKEWGWTHERPPPFDSLCDFIERARDPAAYADNLVNTPVYAIHGAEDRVCPVGHTQSMVSKLRSLDYPVTYRELKDVGHGGFPGKLRTAQRQWLLEQARVAQPSRVVLKAACLRYASARWLRIDEFDRLLTFARIEGRFTPPHTFEVVTRNVKRFAIDLRQSPIGMSERPVVHVDGHVAYAADSETSTLSELAFARAEGGLWRPAGARQGQLKRNGLEGPIDDVFMTPFLVVVGTRAHTPLENRIIAQEAGRFVADWRRLYTRPCRMKKDVDVSDRDVQRYSLVLYGGPRTNAIAERVAPGLPVTFGEESISVAGNTFEGRDVGAKLCFPNPLNPERYVAVFAATTWRGMFQINTRFGNWFDWGVYDNRNWFDYAVFDDRTRSPETFCCVGFFNSAWKTEGSYHFRGDAKVRAAVPPRRVPSPTHRPQAASRLFLSDLFPLRIDQHKGPVGFDRSFQGNGLSVGKKQCRKGLGVRAPSRVDFKLPEAFDRFQSWAGVDLEGALQVNAARARSELVQFVVWGDGRRLYMSQWLRWNSRPLWIDIELDGAAELGLEVRGSGARWLLGSAAWGQVRVVKTPSPAGSARAQE